MYLCVWLLWRDLRHYPVLQLARREWWYMRHQWQLLRVHLCIWLLWSDMRYHAVL